MRSVRIQISNALRFEILVRDRYTCQYCGAKAPDVQLEIDHKIPVSRGGKNTIENLITSCWDCNNGKGNKIIEGNRLIRTPPFWDSSPELPSAYFYANKIIKKLLRLHWDVPEKERIYIFNQTKKYGYEETLAKIMIKLNKWSTQDEFYKTDGKMWDTSDYDDWKKMEIINGYK